MSLFLCEAHIGQGLNVFYRAGEEASQHKATERTPSGVAFMVRACQHVKLAVIPTVMPTESLTGIPTVIPTEGEGPVRAH